MIIARRFSCYTIFSTLTSSTGAATFPLYCFIDPISYPSTAVPMAARIEIFPFVESALPGNTTYKRPLLRYPSLVDETSNLS